MPTVAEILAAIAPEFASVDPGRLAVLETIVRARINPCLGDYAAALAVAHMLSLADRPGSGPGSVVSETEGGLSRTFGSFAWNNAGAWGTTKYGIEYWGLVQGSFLTARNRMVTGCGQGCN